MTGPVLVAVLVLAVPAPSARAETLRLSFDEKDPPTLDPHRQFAQRNHTVCQQIFDGLVRFDPSGRVEPALAVRWERVDPLRLRLWLRPGVAFHDGEPFGAEAVRFSIERYLDPATGFPARAFLSSIDRVEVRSELEVDLVTKHPDGLLLNRLAGFVLIVPPRALAKAGPESFARRPIGTGAFRFERWEEGRSLRLAANEAYWAGRPALDALEFRFLPQDDRIRALLASELDLIYEVPGTRTLAIQKNPDTRIVKGETFFAVYGGLNFSSGPLKDVRVREALNLGVDRRALIRYDLLGNGRALAGFSLPGQPGHEPRLAPYRFEPEKARRLLELAGYGDGLVLRAIVDVNVQRAAHIAAADLARIGVALEMDVVNESDYGRFRERHYDLSIGGLPDPMAHAYFLPSLVLHSRSPYSLAKDPDYDAALEEMVGTIDEARRDERARLLGRRARERHYGLPLYQRLRTYGARAGLDFAHYVTGMPYFFSARFRRADGTSKKP